MNESAQTASLLLSDGTVFTGYSFGVTGTTIGEVVFTTSMTGYQEVLTDPSYYGQIVTQTYPLIGNYGVNTEDFESGQSVVKGYIVREWCRIPSNFRSSETIDAFLKQQNVIGLWGIDTRRLTRMLREHGVMNGAITTDELTQERKAALLEEIRAFVIKDAVKSVTCKEPAVFGKDNTGYRIALFDFGYKRNILKHLLKRNAVVTVVPADTTADEIRAAGYDGVMLSNGPGDPEENVGVIEELRKLVDMNIPIFGICLGHQILALAMGAKTYKLKYGHRGANQPVKHLVKDRTYITSQNHGFAVDSASVPAEVGIVSHVNANDNTCEGVKYTAARAFTVQFHPEASAGPNDTSYLFDDFFAMIGEGTTCH